MGNYEKVEITDAMVERFVKVWYAVSTNCDVQSFVKARKGLEAALNPPPAEPKVTSEVTDAMRGVGMRVGARRHEANFYRDEDVVVAIYNTMRALEPKAELACPTCSGPSRPSWKCGDKWVHTRPGEGGFSSHLHRRKSDPL